MPTVVRTSFDQILLALQAELMDFLEWPAERVIVTARKKLPYDPHGDTYLTIRGLDAVPEDPINDAGGRIDNRCVRMLRVQLRTRLALDESTSDLLWLTKGSVGHHVVEHQVLDCLITFFPTDDDGNHLVTEPIRWRKLTVPEKDEEDNSWGQSDFEAEVHFELDLDQNR